MSTPASHEMTGTSWNDIPGELLERFVEGKTKAAGIFQLASLCRESRHKAADMADSLVRTIESAEFPSNLSKSNYTASHTSLATLSDLLEGVASLDQSSTVYLDSTTDLLFSRSKKLRTPSATTPSGSEDSSAKLLPRHLDTPVRFTKAVEERALSLLSFLEPLYHHFPALSTSFPPQQRIRFLIQGSTSSNAGYALSWDPVTGSLRFHVAAAALKSSPGYKAHNQASVPGSRFSQSLHLDGAADFVTPFDFNFPFAIPEGEATLHWVTARNGVDAAPRKDKVFAHCEYPGDFSSTHNLSLTAGGEGRIVTPVSTVLRDGDKEHVWSWETVKAGKTKVKGKNGWAAKHQGEACVYGKGASGLYLDSIVLELNLQS